VAFIVVLDACVLYPASLRDLLLRLAEVEMYDVKWSQRILNEAVDNLVDDNRMSRDQAAYLMDCMNDTFEDALVPAEAVDRLEPSMTNDEKDRHVLAAAVVAGAQHIITSNLVDFPREATQAHDVEAVHPDDFLLAMLDLDAELVLWVLERQVADLQNPPLSRDELLDALAGTVPSSVARMREVMGQSS
jgi:predicted nucleic acid-binding protein